MTVEPGTAIGVSDRFCRFFDMQSAPHVCLFFAGIELEHVAWPFESDFLLSTVPVCLFVRPPVRKCSVYDDNSTPTNTISLGNIVIRARL